MIAMCIRAGIWVYLIGIHWDDKQTLDTFLSSKHGVDLSSQTCGCETNQWGYCMGCNDYMV